MGKELAAVLKRIQDFLSPVETWNPTVSDSPSEWLDKVLKEKIQDEGDEGLDDGVRWRYVSLGLGLLKDLHAVLVRLSKAESDGPLPADALSVSQQQNVSGLLQLVVVLGAVPSFLPGVGLPVEKRTKFSHVLEHEAGKQDVSVEQRYRRLVAVVEGVLEACSHEGLQMIVLTRHTGDVLAALLQLSFAPLKQPKEEEGDGNDGGFVMTSEKHRKFVEDQARFKGDLFRVMDSVYPPTVVKYLLVLQTGGGGGGKKPVPKSINVQRPPRTPKWLVAACGSLLSELLTKPPNGFVNVVRGILDVGHQDSLDARKFQAVATVISNPPSGFGKRSEMERYYALVCPQILSVLDARDDTDGKTYHLVACACFRAMTERSLTLSRRHLLDVATEPLLRMCEDPPRVVDEKDVDDCIRRLHLLFVVSCDPSSLFVEHLRPAILPLLQLHCKLRFSASSSHLRGPVEEIVTKFVKGSAGALPTRALRSFAFSEAPDEDGFRVVHPDIVFANGDGGGIVAKLRSYDEDDESFYVSDDEKSIAIVDLLDFCRFRCISVDFFLGLLKDLAEVIVEVEDEPKTVGTDVVSKEKQLLAIERELDEGVRSIRKKLMIVRLVSLLSEDDALQEEMMKNSEQKLEFLMSTIRRVAVSCCERRKLKGATAPADAQSIATALSLLRHHVTRKDVKVSDWRLLQSAVGDLGFLRDNHEDEAVAQLCGRLRELVATHGAVVENTDKVRSAAESIAKRTKAIGEKIEQMKRVKENDYSAALQDVADPEIPVRGHGLIALTRLVESEDQECVKNIVKVIDVFKENLEHRDTYVYLQAVKGLAACSSHSPKEVIDLLTDHYRRIDDGGGGVGSANDAAMEIRTKVGEALVRVTKTLGELTPAHKNRLLNPFLGQLNHPDPLVRASCLSNVGEICKNLRFELGSIIFEILQSLNDAISCDPSVEVRRAAVMVIVLLLEGLGGDAISVLQTSIGDIWRSLVRLRNAERDEVTRHHVARAIDQVDRIVRRFFQPDQTLSKTIYVLDEPPKPF